MARVLVVDDEMATLKTICGCLNRAGFRTTPAATGRDAKACALREPPDVAFLNLLLPDMDGLTLFKTLQRQHPYMVGVIVTGHGTASSAVQCLEAGLADYIEKPIHPEELPDFVTRLLWRHGFPGPPETGFELQRSQVRRTLALLRPLC